MRTPCPARAPWRAARPFWQSTRRRTLFSALTECDQLLDVATGPATRADPAPMVIISDSSRACRFTRGNAYAAWDRKSCCSATSSSSPRSYEQQSYPSDSAEADARAQIERALASDRHALMSRARTPARSMRSCSCSVAEFRDRRAREEHVHRGLGTNARAKI